MLPQAHDLLYFTEVADAGSLSAAASRLGLTQPSLTASLQRLEATIGVPLVTRGKRGVVLTPSGKRLQARAQRLLSDWERLRSHVLAAHDEVAGCYTLGCHSAVASYTLPHVLPGLLQKHPALEIRLVHDVSRRILAATVAATVDLGIVINPIRHPDLVILKVREDEFTLWRGANGPMSDPVSGEAVLLCDENLLQTQHLARRYRRLGWTFARITQVPDLNVLASLVAAGAGIGVLPASIAKPQNLQRIPQAPSYRDELSVVVRAEHKRNRALQAIRDTILAALHKSL